MLSAPAIPASAACGLVLLVQLLGGCVSAPPAPPVPPAPPADAPPPPPPPVEGVAIVESVRFLALESFPVRGFVYLSGYLPDAATKVAETRVAREDNRFVVTVVTERPRDAVATTALVPFERRVPLDLQGLPQGTYTVAAGQRSATFTLERDNVAL